MFKRLSLFWALFRGDARHLWFAVRHPRAPRALKVGAGMIVLYLFSPIDIIPDWLPFIGVVDDLVLVPLAVRWLVKQVPPDIAQEAAERRPR
ncbi:MAG: DUF1232 domain-containing protein [Haliea sp.]|nr:MAG: DUF1232 domain-containing protein [Haliea sp.]